ncbi:MAG: hypothetical protein P1U56_24835 [Saprospiraceae bacterium]|nr:hypothetical protein [Saprospiraceae bacterium]
MNFKLKVLRIFLFSFSFIVLGCSDDKICTTCMNAVTGVSTSFCGDEQEVTSFESGVLDQGAAQGEIWGCVRN